MGRGADVMLISISLISRLGKVGRENGEGYGGWDNGGGGGGVEAGIWRGA